MCKTIAELATYAPRFAGQKAYCDQTRIWYTAVYSLNSGRLLWAIL